MMVLLVERVSPSLRGELTRWLLEVRAGVFVGNVSATVREKLWERVESGLKDGAATLLQSTDTEQGFTLRVLGARTYQVRDFEGLQLICRV